MQVDKGPGFTSINKSRMGEAAASGTIWHYLPAASDQHPSLSPAVQGVSSMGTPCALPQEEHPAPGPHFQLRATAVPLLCGPQG